MLITAFDRRDSGGASMDCKARTQVFGARSTTNFAPASILMRLPKTLAAEMFAIVIPGSATNALAQSRPDPVPANGTYSCEF